MGRGVTRAGRQPPSERPRHTRHGAWRRARPGFRHVFPLSLLWSSLGHMIVIGSLILHFAGRPPELPGIEIFAAEPLAETEQLPLKEVARADTPAARRRVDFIVRRPCRAPRRARR